MPEQFEFNFTPATTEEELKKMRNEYKSVFFVLPTYNLSATDIAKALADPNKERERLEHIASQLESERAEDQEESKRKHPHGYNPRRAGSPSHSH